MGCRKAACRVAPARWTLTQRPPRLSTRSLEVTIGAKVGIGERGGDRREREGCRIHPLLMV